MRRERTDAARGAPPVAYGRQSTGRRSFAGVSPAQGGLEDVEEEASELSGSGEEGSGSSVASRTTGSRSCDVAWDRGARGAPAGEEAGEEEWEDEGEWEEDWGGGQGGGVDPEQGGAYGGGAPASGWASRLDASATAWIKTENAECVVGGLIGLNALVIGMEVEAELRFGDESAISTALYFLQCCFALVFVCELLLRVRAIGCRQIFCRNPDGVFDALVVLITVIDLWVVNPLVRYVGVIGGNGQKSLDALSVLRILQLLRLVRIIRLLRVSRQLSLLIVGLAKSFKSVLWVFLMLFVVIYIGALFCASELGSVDHEELQRAFGTIWLSMYSHFKIMTLEAWPDICGWAMEQNTLWAFYFIGYIMITNLALVNLVTGLVMDGVLQGAKTEDWTTELNFVEAGPFVSTVRDVIMGQDKNHDRYLDREEFKDLLADPLIREMLEIYGISLRIEPDDLFDVLDVHGAGRLSTVETAGALLRLRGSREALHPLLVRDDLHRESRRVLGALKACEQRVAERFDGEVRRVEQALCARLRDLQQQAGEATASALQLQFGAPPEPQKPGGCAVAEPGPGGAEEAAALLEASPPAGDAKCSGKDLLQEPPAGFVAGGAAAELPEEPPEGAAAAEELPECAEAAEDGDLGGGAGDVAWVVDLLRRASAQVRQLEEAVRGAETELLLSLDKEAALEAELARGEASRATQTAGLGPETVELELAEDAGEEETP